MKRNVYTEKIINKCCIKYRNGIAVRDIVIETGVPRSTIYYWLKQYGDIDTSEEITYKKSFENMQRKYEKERQICEVLLFPKIADAIRYNTIFLSWWYAL